MVWPDQATAPSAPGAPCLGVSTLVHDTLELNYCTKLFLQNVRALSAILCKTRHYTNVVCCCLLIPFMKLSPSPWYLRVISPKAAFRHCVKASFIRVNMLEK